MKIFKKIFISIIVIIGVAFLAIYTKASNENIDITIYFSQHIKPKISYQEACARPDAIGAINYYIKHDLVDKEGLLIAAENNTNEEIVKLLLSSADYDENTKNNALWKSLTNSNPQVCKSIIEAGADVNTKNTQGETPLIVAYTKGNIEIMTMLLASGADANVKNANGETLLQIEYAKEKPNLDIMKTLIDNCAIPDVKNAQSETLLQLECSKLSPNIDIIRLLISGGADPNIKNKNGDTIFMTTYLKGNSGFLAIMDELIKGKADVNVKNKKGETPLIIECSKEYPNLGVITTLVRGGARLNVKNSKGETPLFIACSRSSANTTGIVTALLNGDANIEEKNSNGDTPLIVACANGKLDIADILIKNGADIEARNKKGETPLLVACSNGKLTVVSFLIANGANTEVKNYHGDYPITAARRNNHQEVVKYFEKLQAEKIAKEKAEHEAKVKRKYVDSIKKQMVFISSENIEVLSTEVTQEMYEKVIGTNPSKNKGNKNPVENVSWFDAILFCNKLSVMGGLAPVYSGSGANISVNSSANGFRLPTVFEWLAAAEGGDNYLYAGGDNIDEVAWYYDNSAYSESYIDRSIYTTDYYGVHYYTPQFRFIYKTHPVAQKKANGYGLYDMSGNVYEWCWDKSSDHSEHYRSYMGGCYNSNSSDCEIANLRKNLIFVSTRIRPYTEKDDKLGFRIVRNMTISQKAEEEVKEKAEAEKEKAVAEAKARAEAEKIARDKAETAARAKTALEEWSKKENFITIPDKDFKMMKTEVTQELYMAIMGENPSSFKGEKIPVDQVNWYNAVEFCNKLSTYMRLTPVYSIKGHDVTSNASANGFRLPTVEEWEYAAKGGEKYVYAGSDNIDEVAWYSSNSKDTTHPVAQKKSNGYGLYDMSGNVREWCWDSLSRGDRRYSSGGSMLSTEYYCRISQSTPLDMEFGQRGTGFRVVRNIK